MENKVDCVIIGAGVAGMTSAIYLKRAGLNPILIEKSAPGGQINNTYEIENYPGFTKIDGPTLAQNIYNQIKNLNINYKYGNVISIEKNENLIVKTDRETIIADTIILANGRVSKTLNLPNEQKFIGHGISFCAMCDGMLYKDKTVAVIGGGNSALEESLYLAKICKKVHLIHRRDTFTGDKIFQQKILEQNNIEIHYNSNVTSLEGEQKLEGITINGTTNIEVDGMFIYIGKETQLDFLSNLNIKLENNHIVVDKNMQTNIDGIFACGDVIKKEVYQISTATAEGTIAAYSVQKYLEKNK